MRINTLMASAAAIALLTAGSAIASEEKGAAEKKIPAATMDTDGDGKMDAWDRDGNGKADAWDVDGDGKPDLFDDDGDGKPEKRADPKKR